MTESHLGGGADLLAVMKAQGMEGLIAKRRTSPYEPGRRSGAWRKLKVRRQQEFVIGGWLPGEGNRASTLGALLIGYHDETGALRYAGRVGTGFTDPELQALSALLDGAARDTDPFDPAAAPGRRARTAAGSSPAWWSRWRSASGRPTACCAIRRTSAAASTRTRRGWCASRHP